MSQAMLQPSFYQAPVWPPSVPRPEEGEHGHHRMFYLNPDPTYVGFWRRALAYLIDFLILAAIGGLLPISTWGEWVLDLIYFVVLPCTNWQATIGKLVVGAKIVDGEGERLSFWRSVGRYFAQFISGIILCIGFIMIAFSAEKRGLHDHICNTYVLERDSQLYPET